MKIDISIKEIEGEGYLCIKLADLTLLKRSKAFKPPSIEEVKEYCKERKNGVDSVKWWNFYNAKNWMIGKTKMKNWKSAVITWEGSESTIVNQNGEIHRGTNLADPPPEFFGVPSKTAITYQEYKNQKE